MEILQSARRHQIADDDIHHAAEHAIASIIEPGRADFSMLIGPDRAGRLLEIGVIDDGEFDYVIHAMSARPKYLKLVES